MDFWDSIFQHIFHQKPHEHMAWVEETLTRTPKFLYEFAEWEGANARNMLKRVYTGFMNNSPSPHKRHAVLVYKSPCANGIAVYPDEHIQMEDLQMFSELLKNKVEKLGYNLCVSKRLFYDKSNYVETIEKYHLKPSIHTPKVNGLSNQLYGNILIEYIQHDNKPKFMRFMTQVYIDRAYSSALRFEELMEKLLHNAH